MAADKKNLEAKWSEYLEQQKRDNVKYMLLSAAGILTVLIIWQGVVMLGLVDSRLLPPPTTVLATLVDKFSNTVPDGNVLGTNILASLQVALLVSVWRSSSGFPWDSSWVGGPTRSVSSAPSSSWFAPFPPSPGFPW